MTIPRIADALMISFPQKHVRDKLTEAYREGVIDFDVVIINPAGHREADTRFYVAWKLPAASQPAWNAFVERIRNA